MLTNQLVSIRPPPPMPALIIAAGEPAQLRFLEFFAANIRNPHTRSAYARGCREFFSWCQAHDVASITAVQPLHVAGYIEELSRARSAPTVKQRLAAIRGLCDWLVTGQILPVNPAGSVRGPSNSVRRGDTPVLSPEDARHLLDSIDVATDAGLRDRALIALMVYSFARIGAALKMRVEDVYLQNRRLWVRLHEKGGKRQVMPCHHSLEEYLHAYIDGCGLAEHPNGPLFRTIARSTRRLSESALPQDSAFQVVRRRGVAAGIKTAIGSHSLRAKGITASLEYGDTLELEGRDGEPCLAADDAALKRRSDEMIPDEVARVTI